MTSANAMLPEPSCVVDTKYPRHTLLAARYKQSFAYKTMRIRLPSILLKITEDITKDIEDTVAEYGELNLWGNRCDLSLSCGIEVNFGGNPFELVKSLDENVIVDQCAQIIDCLKSADKNSPVVIELICDNAGYELFTDLILADYLIESKLANMVRFNLKAMPWFISDVTLNDFRWSLQFLKDHTSSVLQEFGKKWQKFVVENKFQVASLDYFLTSPYEYYRMSEIDPNLYARLSAAHLVIIKGDLNYRKLIGDFSWDSTESFTTCLRGFLPTNVCSLRTVKADVICGLAEGLADKLEKANKDWMTTGEYGTIQFASR